MVCSGENPGDLTPRGSAVSGPTIKGMRAIVYLLNALGVVVLVEAIRHHLARRDDDE